MELFDQLKPSTTIITPNRRLSATLLKKYNQIQLNRGKDSWQTIDILPHPNWTLRLWDEMVTRSHDLHPYVLTPQQEMIVWEDILKHSERSDTLLQVSTTADLVKTAWGILKQWDVNLDHPLLDLTEDSRVFKEWADEFMQRSEEHHWIDTNSLLAYLTKHLVSEQFKLPEELWVVGFNEITPLQELFFKQLEERNVKVSYPPLSDHSLSCHYISLSDEETEIKTMAEWAKSLFNTHNNTITIGCVIPTLSNCREQVINIFSDVFAENKYYALDYNEFPFNISAGMSVTSYPIIKAALTILKIDQSHLKTSLLSYLMQSPFLGEAEIEYVKRAQFIKRLHVCNIASLSLDTVLKPHDKFNLSQTCPLFHARLTHFYHRLQNLPDRATISFWVDTVIALLDTLGWPGERSLNSQEYQVVKRLLDLLSEFRDFDSLFSDVSFHDALHYLERLMDKTIFQAETSDAPIQILGLLEAADIPFDHLWVMGLDDSNWPPQAKPNPFIPLKLQKLLNMPHSTADRELNYASQLTEQLKRSATTSLFSHSTQKADYELRKSPLLNHMQPITLDQLSLSSSITPINTIFQSRLLEEFRDDIGPALQPFETIRGGSLIFKHQAACPFKAFAEIRLFARKVKTSSIGLRPEERGTITHKALELIWKHLKNSDRLHQYSDEELNEIIHGSIHDSMTSHLSDQYRHKHYYLLEVARLEKLLWNWLQLEKSRPPFSVIVQEEELQFNIQGIPINLRIDRIDQLQDGSYLIIDYKTGKQNSIRSWFSERPDEPQLPLYCLHYANNAMSIAFATIHPDNLSFQGIAANDVDITNIKTLDTIQNAPNAKWEDQLLSWRKTLEQLAHDFHDGYADVNPKDRVETCRYCDLKGLCRISAL